MTCQKSKFESVKNCALTVELNERRCELSHDKKIKIKERNIKRKEGRLHLKSERIEKDKRRLISC